MMFQQIQLFCDYLDEFGFINFEALPRLLLIHKSINIYDDYKKLSLTLSKFFKSLDQKEIEKMSDNIVENFFRNLTIKRYSNLSRMNNIIQSKVNSVKLLAFDRLTFNSINKGNDLVEKKVGFNELSSGINHLFIENNNSFSIFKERKNNEKIFSPLQKSHENFNKTFQSKEIKDQNDRGFETTSNSIFDRLHEEKEIKDFKRRILQIRKIESEEKLKKKYIMKKSKSSQNFSFANTEKHYANKRIEFERLMSEKEKKIKQECTFKPKISKGRNSKDKYSTIENEEQHNKYYSRTISETFVKLNSDFKKRNVRKAKERINHFKKENEFNMRNKSFSKKFNPDCIERLIGYGSMLKERALQNQNTFYLEQGITFKPKISENSKYQVKENFEMRNKKLLDLKSELMIKIQKESYSNLNKKTYSKDEIKENNVKIVNRLYRREIEKIEKKKELEKSQEMAYKEKLLKKHKILFRGNKSKEKQNLISIKDNQDNENEKFEGNLSFKADDKINERREKSEESKLNEIQGESYTQRSIPIESSNIKELDSDKEKLSEILVTQKREVDEQTQTVIKSKTLQNLLNRNKKNI